MKVLVATDGSELAVDAARRGLALLAPNPELVVLSVLSEMPGAEASGFAGAVYTPEEQSRIELGDRVEAQADIDATLRALGDPPAERMVELGDPAGVVCEVAGRIGADVVVMGSHGRGLVARVLLGSVSEYVVRNAPCPVLVVRLVDEA